MIQCANCGQPNTDTSNFCRFCGTKFLQSQMREEGTNYDYSPPRPYSWKTDEFQIADKQSSKTQPINRLQPFTADPYRTEQTARPPQSMIYQPPQQMNYGYRCPRCGTQALPLLTRRISTAGWITFAVLLVTTGIFFWIGLLIREDARVCPVCNLQIN
ncbi:MAG: zinc ribbon domain-containing protein [Acidobacteriota bacterium]|nr:zinc ribbon domain-containing protein [Acidobacteriota bacterium]